MLLDTDTDSDFEALSLKELELSELLAFVVPKTTVSFATKTSDLFSVFSKATASFANTLVCVATAPPKTAPVVTTPRRISNPVIEWLTLSSTTSVIT